VFRLPGHGLFWLLLSAVLLLLPGCKKKGSTMTPEAIHLQALTKLYGQFLARNKGRGPRDAAELKAFVARLPKSNLESMGIDPALLDSYFVSPRDSKPYVFRDRSKAPTPPPAVILYEQEGTGGKRMVGFETTKVEEVDAARFKELVPEAS
jgi:hypothetical protein